jgi:hemerythrin
MRIEWDEGYSLGVEELDSQHRELFSRFNELISACDAGNGADEALRMLEFLTTYVAVHFAEEEALQRRYGYPDAYRHQDEHDAFVRELTGLEQQVRVQGPIPRLVATTNQIVAVWLIDHISRADAEFARYLFIAHR